MYVRLILTCSCFYILHIIFVTAFTTSIGRYKVSERIPKINRCVSELTSKKEFSGFVRVNKSSGQCEESDGQWNEDKNKSGYVYAIATSLKKSIKPSKNIENQGTLYLNFPATFNVGTSYSLYVTWPKITWDTIQMWLYKEFFYEYLMMRVDHRGNYLEVLQKTVNRKPDRINLDHVDDLPGSDYKISFVANGNNSIKILFNGKSMITWTGNSTCYDQLGSLKVYYRETSFDHQFRIHSTEYINRTPDMTSGDRFKDKVAIVTGGCCGIGRGCADVLAGHGGKVAVLDVNDEEGQKLNNENMYYIHCDMNSEDAIKNAIEQVVEKFKRIDCLVNNVGAHPGNHSIDELSVESFRKLLNVNLVSYFAASKYALPYLRKTKGSIVNITSISGHAGTANSPSYCATKGGGISFTKALAIDEAKYGVRVNAISPSAVNTPLYRGHIACTGDAEKTNEIVASYTLLNRVSEPREMGMACLFLAVDATYTTGTELMCTAGSEIGYGVKGMSDI